MREIEYRPVRLREHGQALAPIWINVATENHEEIASVRGFLEILVSQLVARANSAADLSERARNEILARSRLSEPLGAVDVTNRGELGGSYWLLNAGVAREVSRSVDAGAAYRATADVRAAAQEILATISGKDLVPVLVADDTDRLLRVAGDDEAKERLFTSFFGDVLREVAESLECGVLISAHDAYRERDDYEALTTGLVTGVDVPALDRIEHFAAIVDARVRIVDPACGWQDLIAEDGLARLLELYEESGRSLRLVLTRLREALTLAAGGGAGPVERRHLDGAAAG